MVKVTIDNINLEVNEGTTILEAAKQAGISIPTLCYLKEINEIGACRVCVVEVEGMNKLVAACNNVVTDGMVIYTNSAKALEARKVNVQLVLSQHDCYCPTCVRSGNCTLQTVANELGLLENPYKREVPANNWDKTFPLIRDDSKCIKCMRCVQVCHKVQGLDIWDVVGSGSRTTVGVSLGRTIRESDCALCGQCITHCPVGALRERDDTQKVIDAIADPEVVTLVQMAPAVRTAWGESIGLERSEATVNKLVDALKKIGIDYVFDTNFSADLTIMEEGSEFLERLTHKDQYSWPMFTSCCPGWVRFIKSQYPEYVKNLSTAKSPQQMFGAVAKSYFPEKKGIDPKKIFSISIMPCTAKKHECDIPVMTDAGAGKDVDVVLTTREIDRLIKMYNIDAKSLKDVEFDSPLGDGTGAAVIFGTTGGVMEAALRSAYFLVTGSNPDPDAFAEVRGLKGWKENNFEINGIPVRTATASGLGNTRKLMEAIKNGEAEYDFVEIMACPGGCTGGGGQPIWEGEELAGVRGENLYDIDKHNPIRFSHENPSVTKLYEEYMEKPLSHKSHHLLHTDHEAWTMPLKPER